jgi:hypothetical protein
MSFIWVLVVLAILLAGFGWLQLRLIAYPRRSVKCTVVAFVVVLSVTVPSGGQADAQIFSAQSIKLPASARLSDVEIRWRSDGGDGCGNPGGCSHYDITLRGEGVVTLRERPWGVVRPEPPIRRRPVDPVRIVDLVNELFRARFLEAAAFHDSVPFAIRSGDVLTFGSWGSGSEGWVDLTLRIASMENSVRLKNHWPKELRDISERIWRMAGPESWAP